MRTLTPQVSTSEQNKTSYSPEEYLALEEKAEFKSEYRNGEIIALAVGTINHNKIALNFCRQFPLTIETKNYEVFMSDVKVWIPEYNIYTYPDVMIVADKPIYQSNTKTTIINPLLIIEVLLLSTQNYDRGQKFKYYRSLDSLHEYILIDQYEYGIEQFAKNQEGKWVLTEYKKEKEILGLESLSWEISLTEIYKRVDFS